MLESLLPGILIALLLIIPLLIIFKKASGVSWKTLFITLTAHAVTQCLLAIFTIVLAIGLVMMLWFALWWYIMS